MECKNSIYNCMLLKGILTTVAGQRYQMCRAVHDTECTKLAINLEGCHTESIPNSCAFTEEEDLAIEVYIALNK